MRGTVVWVAFLYLGALGIPGAAVAQDGRQMEVATGPRFLAPARGASKVPAQRWTDASKLPALQRRISVDLRNVPLRAALRDVGAKAGLRITYSPNVLRDDRPVMLTAETITVGAALGALLYDAKVDVLLMTGGQAVVVARGEAHIPAGDLVGWVTDAKSGQKLAGVDVFLENTRWRTATDSSGRYTLTDVDAGSYTLIARRLGYAKLSRKITVSAEQRDTVDVALESVAVPLNDLVTTATGPQRRRDLGNAITTIRADSVLRTAPIRNLTDLLEDRVPGLNIQHTSGAPGDPARLRLRGISSVMRGNDPVVIVDGVRVYSAQSDARSGNLTNLSGPQAFWNSPKQGALGSLNTPAPSPLDQIDMNTVEKVEIFKGPSAATMYGADAANGVMVITTKRGKPGPTRWQARIDHGRTNTPGRYPEGYYQWGHNNHSGITTFCTLTNLACVPDSLARFQALNDPALTVLGRGNRTALSLSASGGTQALTYSITGTYSDETGLLTLPAMEAERFRTRFNREAPDWMQRPHQLKNWSVASNVGARLGASADVTLFSSLSRTQQQRSTLERQVAPLSGTYVDRVNGIYYRPQAGYFLDTTQVLDDYYTRTTASAINFTSKLNASWRPRSWFTATGQAGLEVTPRDDQVYLPAGMVATADSGAIIQGTGRSLVSTFNLQGSLRKPLGLGFVFNTSVGANLLTTNTEELVTSASQLTPGTSTIGGARSIYATNDNVRTSVFGWYIEPSISGEKISLSTGIRLDGGSNYGARVRGGNLLSLPKLNGSWTISEEPFFPFKSLFSSLRLRGSYGQSQVQPGPADRLRLYTRRREVGGLGQWLGLTTLGNSQLRPERSTEFEGGVDADLLDSRVSIEVTAYRKMQVDAMMPVTLPGSVNGGGSVVRNIGNILNKGFELTVGITPTRSPAVTWNAQLIYTHNYNKLMKLGEGVEANPRDGIVAGYPVGGRWARPILGYGDANGNGVLQATEIQVGDSLVYLGQLLPRHLTALHTTVALFGGMFSLAAAVNYEAGGTQLDETARTNWVLARALVDPSTPYSEQAAVLAYDSTTYGLTQDITTFRFNTFSVSYRAPAQIARLLRASQMSVSVQGRNLGLHSNYRGKDPDVNAWSPSETIVDTGQLPQPRTWQLAISLDY